VCLSKRTERLKYIGNTHFAALTGDAAVMVASCFVPTHNTQLILVQVTWYVPYKQLQVRTVMYTFD